MNMFSFALGVFAYLIVFEINENEAIKRKNLDSGYFARGGKFYACREITRKEVYKFKLDKLNKDHKEGIE